MDLSMANSRLLRFILVVIVLNTFVTPIREITVINPYRNISITIRRLRLFSISSASLRTILPP